MPTNKQRREQAQRHLQRQLERRERAGPQAPPQPADRVTAVAVLVGGRRGADHHRRFGGDDDKHRRATSTAAPSDAARGRAPTNADGTVGLQLHPRHVGQPNLKDVGTPPDAGDHAHHRQLDAADEHQPGRPHADPGPGAAPCAAASFTYLAQQGFFDGSPCHREVNQATFGVLQCGDPTGTGAGRADVQVRPGGLRRHDLPAGHHRHGQQPAPNSTGSQFFLCFTDTQLPPDYTAVGTVDEAGLAVLDKIAAAGNDGSFAPSAGGGAPKTPVTITSMTVVG